MAPRRAPRGADGDGEASTPPPRASLFYPFRALGYVSEPVPFATQRRGTKTFVTVSAGKAWQTYDCDKLRLVLVGPMHGDGPDVAALATRGDLTFAAVGRDVIVSRRTRRLCVLEGHAERVARLFVFGERLYSFCDAGRVLAWDVGSDAVDHLDGTRRKKIAGATQAPADADSDSDSSSDSDSASDSSSSSASAPSDPTRPVREYVLPTGFLPTAVCHPDTYLNKLLLGSSDGRMLILNVHTGDVIYVFQAESFLNPERVAVTCLANSPALDTVAVGLADGRCVIHNVLHDKTVMDFGHDGAKRPVRSCAFTSGSSHGEPLLAVAGDSGTISVWSLEKRRLRTVLVGAHDGACLSLYFFPGRQTLMSSGADNAVKQWIFDNADGSGRLLRFRAGHGSPPTKVAFYGENGHRLLSAGGEDRALRVFSAIQDQQSRELSQQNVERRAKKLKIAEQELKLPPVAKMAWCQTRERDWANVVTCHEGDQPRAYTWRLKDGVLGEHVLAPPARIGRGGAADKKGAAVRCVAVSACGNFAFVGTAGGDAHRFNLQSGAHRGAFKRPSAPPPSEDPSSNSPTTARKNPTMNLRGGAKSIWTMSNESYAADFIAKQDALTAPAHSGFVAAIETDGANKTVVTGGGADGFVRAWRFGDRAMRFEMQTGSPVLEMKAHGPSGLVAVANDDRVVRVFDIQGQRRVRSLRGPKTRITSMEFASDGRWVLASTEDGAVRVWDVPAATLLQTMRMSGDARVVAMSLSPTMDLLATVHEGRRGVYLWANAAMFAPAGGGGGGGGANGSEEGVRGGVTRGGSGAGGGEGEGFERDADEAPPDDVEVRVDLPRLHADADEADDIVLGAPVEVSTGGGDVRAPSSREAREGAAGVAGGGEAPRAARRPVPAAPGLATMALLPRTQWMGLLHLETIRERNKPVAPPTKPEAAPFFLPTVAGLERDAVFDLAEKTASDDEAGGSRGEDGEEGAKSRILTAKSSADGGDVEGVLLRLLRRGKKRAEEAEEAEGKNARRRAAEDPADDPYEELLAHLRSRGPSALDAEIRALGPWDAATMTDADAAELEDALDFFAHALRSGREYEFVNALLAHVLRTHGEAIRKRESLRLRAARLREVARKTWAAMDHLMNEVRCALGFFAGTHGG